MTDETTDQPTSAEMAQDVADFLTGDSKPTPEDAREMFKDNPGLAYVVTTEGGLHRNGILEQLA